MFDNRKIITFEAYYNPMLAHIILSRLKANRVPCFIADDNILQAKPYFNQLLGGVKIKIFEKDIEKCKEILAENLYLQEQDDKGIKIIDEVVCPYCGSANVRYGDAVEFKFHWPSLLVSLFLGVPFYFRNAWHCFNCHRDGA